MKDILEKLLDDARTLQSTYYNKDQALMHRLGTGCMVNLSQAMDLDWKMVGNPNPKKTRERLMGLVDAFHYILSMLSQQEEDSNKLRNLLVARRAMVEDLHLSFSKLNDLINPEKLKERKIAVVDIDNVIYPYDIIWNLFQNIHGVPEKMTRDQCKDLYRISGLKAITPPIKDADKLLQLLHDKGYTVILLSAREVNLYPEVYVDTLSFLRRYKLYYDILLFKKEKRGGSFTEKILHHTDIFIDDTVEQMNYASCYPISTRILVTEESYEIESHIIPVATTSDVVKFLSDTL